MVAGHRHPTRCYLNSMLEAWDRADLSDGVASVCSLNRRAEVSYISPEGTHVDPTTVMRQRPVSDKADSQLYCLLLSPLFSFVLLVLI
jgi:hypothetical protein